MSDYTPDEAVANDSLATSYGEPPAEEPSVFDSAFDSAPTYDDPVPTSVVEAPSLEETPDAPAPEVQPDVAPPPYEPPAEPEFEPDPAPTEYQELLNQLNAPVVVEEPADAEHFEAYSPEGAYLGY